MMIMFCLQNEIMIKASERFTTKYDHGICRLIVLAAETDDTANYSMVAYTEDEEVKTTAFIEIKGMLCMLL